MPQSVLQPDGTTTNAHLTGKALQGLEFEGGSCLTGDFVDATIQMA